MRKRAIVFPLVMAFAFAAAGLGQAADKSIALTMKVTGDVQIRKAGSDKKEPLKFGTPLDDGDWIRTGDNGTVTIIFSDDKSLITLQPRTEVVVGGKRDAQANIAKRVSMDVGQLFAKVERQRGTLEIATPTSVASVKGTEFWVVVFPDGTTEVITLEGLVELMNNISRQAVNVGSGQTGRSEPNGNNNVGPTPEGGVPQGAGGGEGAEPKVVEIRVVDPDGNARTILIQYVEP